MKKKRFRSLQRSLNKLLGRSRSVARHRAPWKRLSAEGLEGRLLLAGDLQVRFEPTATSVEVGQDFDLNVYVKDNRAIPGGVTSVFLDVAYEGSLAGPNGSIVHGPDYNGITDGANLSGLIDEAGGGATSFPAPADPGAEYLLLTVPLTATSAGTLTFTPQDPQNFGSVNLLAYSLGQVPFEELDLTGDFMVQITDGGSGGGNVSFSLSGDASVTEGASADYVLAYTGSLPAGQTARVDVALQDLTTETADHGDLNNAINAAVAGATGVSYDGTAVTFAAGGDTSLDFSVATVNDSDVEGNEQFQVAISNPQTSDTTTADISSASVVTLIIDNDEAPPPAGPLVDYTLVLNDTGGVELTRETPGDPSSPYVVSPGQTFVAQVFVDDLRTDVGANGGVSAAFADLVASTVTGSGTLVNWDEASLQVAFPVLAVPLPTVNGATVDEAGGGLNSLTPPGADPEQLLFTIEGTVSQAATNNDRVQLQLDAADMLPDHETLVRGISSGVLASYESEELLVVAQSTGPIVAYTVVLTDVNGVELQRETPGDQNSPYVVEPGQVIEARVSVDDLRNVGSSGGVSAAFADLMASDASLLTWDSASLQIDFPVIAPPMPTVSGALVDEAGGGLNTLTPPGADPEQLLFTVRGTISSAATGGESLTVALDAADDLPDHATLVRGMASDVAASYGSAALVISEAPPPSGGPSWQNATNPLDVNDDGSVTLLDLNIVLDEILTGGVRVLDEPPIPPDVPNPTPGVPGSARFFDTTGDGNLTLGDAQAIADFINVAPLALEPAAAEAEPPVPPPAETTAPAAAAPPIVASSSIDTSASDTASVDTSSSESQTESQLPSTATAPPTVAVTTAPSAAPALTVEAAEAIVDAAIERFVEAGIDETQQALLQSVEVVVADLPDRQIGEAVGTQITIDIDAGQAGWYVDPTPELDEEFVHQDSHYSAVDAAIAQRVDLLTVVEHELGHVLGLEDLNDAGDEDDLMFHWLTAGRRKLPSPETIDQLFADGIL